MTCSNILRRHSKDGRCSQGFEQMRHDELSRIQPVLGKDGRANSCIFPHYSVLNFSFTSCGVLLFRWSFFYELDL